MRGKRVAIKMAKKIASQYINGKSGSKGCKKHSIDVKEIAESFGIKVVEHEFSDEMSGVFIRKGDDLFIGVNKSHSNTRKRFTIAHEIGHFLLHSEDVIHHDNINLESPSVVLYRSENNNGGGEVEANAFAAELLMPEILVDACIESGVSSIDDLADEFDVSPDAMRYRLINLDYI